MVSALNKACITLALAAVLGACAAAAPTVEFAGIYEGQTIGGIYAEIEALVYCDLPITRVDFYLDGWLFRTETVAPYAFNGDFQGIFYGWDTTIYPNGEYEIRAEAYDELEGMGSAIVNLNIFNNHPPTAWCEADINFGNVPLTVAFTGHASDPDGQDLLFNWNFGDAVQSGERNPVHIFNMAGVYIVRFTVVDPNEASASSEVCIRVGVLPYLEEDGMATLEAEDYDLWFPADSQKWSGRTDKPGYSGQGFIQYLPDIGVTHHPNNDGPYVEYWLDLKDTERYYIWIRGYATAGSASCNVGLNGCLACDNVSWSGYGCWGWTNHNGEGGIVTADVYDAGVNVISIHGRDDGLAIDKIILTTNPTYTPYGIGPGASTRAARLSDVDGDCTFDGKVDILDMIFIRNRLSMDVNISDNRWADVTGDNAVNVLDLIFVRNHLNGGS